MATDQELGPAPIMCNHSYTPNPRTNVSASKRCPFPDLFKELAPDTAHTPEGIAESSLPVDDTGHCIFHSQAIQWKRDHKFADWFSQAVQRFADDTSSQTFDFSETVLVGDDEILTGRAKRPTLRLENLKFSKRFNFNGASFLDPIEIVDVTFAGGASFDNAIYDGTLIFKKTVFMGFSFTEATLSEGIIISDADFRGYALFDKSQFIGPSINFLVFCCRDSTFGGITTFSNTIFSGGPNFHNLFERTTFDDYLDFDATEFRSALRFKDVCFTRQVDFKNTLFAPVDSTAKFRSAAFELDTILLPATGAIFFESTDPLKKMFKHDVFISFKKEPEGKIRFENVNFHRILETSRNKLKDLERTGQVSIGPGCIKYRLQTEIRSIQIDSSNAPLVAEICQTFATYFSARNGLNLGFEIVSKTKDEVRFFYFTDEDISRELFLDRLERTEKGLWELISARPDLSQLAAQTEPIPPERSPVRSMATQTEDHPLINAVDAISAMFGTFFRVSVRIMSKTWKPRDTQRLLQAIHFGDGSHLEGRANSLHQAIVRNYTPDSLDEINSRHHAGLLPMATTTTPQTILFLGADPSDSSELALHRELQEIDQRLRSANLRDAFRLEQRWEVQADQLPGVIMRFNPRILHFCGHGQNDGALVFLDAHGIPSPVDKGVISSLFAILGNSIQCVVLNACYSPFRLK